MAWFPVHFLLSLACFSAESSYQDLDAWNALPDLLLVQERSSRSGVADFGPGQAGIAVTDIGTFLDASLESLGLRNESLVLHAHLTSNETYAILKKISAFGLPSQVHLTISVLEPEDVEESDLNSFLANINDLLLASNFYPQNPLFIQVTVTAEERLNCFVGYRIDVIHNYVLIKNVTEDAGVCSLEAGAARKRRLMASLTNDLGNTQLIAAFVPDEETSFDTDAGYEIVDGTSKFIAKGGYAVEILWALRRLLNFSIVPYLSETWGAFNTTTQQWRGSVFHVEAGHVDISVSSAAMTRSRSTVVGFNVGTHYITMGVFFKGVRKNAAQFGSSLVAPFRPSLWAAIFVWILINGSIYFLFLKPSNDSKTSKGRPEESKRDCTEFRESGPDALTLIGNVISLSLNPLCQRDCHWIPSNFGLRCVYAFQLLTGLVLYSSYAGILVSFLSIEKPAITNLTDMTSEEYPFKFGVDSFQLTRQMLDNCNCSAQEPDLVKMFEWSKVPGTKNEFIEYEDAWDEVRKGKLAYIIDDMDAFAALRKWTASDACDNQDLLFPFSKLLQGTFVKKRSEIKKVVDYGIIKLRESGLVHRLKTLHLPTRIPCPRQKTFTGAGVADMQMALQILLASALLCIIILFLELTYTHLIFKYRLSKILRHGWLN